MKELKFRVYAKYDEFNEWQLLIENDFSGYFVGCEQGELFYACLRDNYDGDPIFEGHYPGDDVYKICQFTGYKDKNGIDIYESDILEVAGGAKIVVNDLAEFLIYCGRYEEKHGVELFPSVQVIGNIYENGEMT